MHNASELLRPLSLPPWLLTLAAGMAAAQTRSLVVSTYGFNGELLKKHVYDPFKAHLQMRAGDRDRQRGRAPGQAGSAPRQPQRST